MPGKVINNSYTPSTTSRISSKIKIRELFFTAEPLAVLRHRSVLSYILQVNDCYDTSQPVAIKPATNL
jgi:hypothetical protein